MIAAAAIVGLVVVFRRRKPGPITIPDANPETATSARKER